MSTRAKMLFALLLLAAAVAAYYVNKALNFVALGVAAAPNAGRLIRPEDDPGPAELAQLGVSRQLRVPIQPAISLSVWVVEPVTQPPRATVLVLHGIRGNKTQMMTVARKLAATGYRAVLVDSRGHGLSTGDWLGFGALESRDLQEVIEALTRQGLLAGNLGVYGPSYGGATAIILAGRDPRVKAVVAVTTFTSMHEEVLHYARHHGWTDWMKRAPAWVIRLAVHRAGRLGGFDPQEASPLTAIRKTPAPVLLIHGKADDFIPTEHSVRVHAAAPDHSELVLLDGEGHGSIFFDHNGTIATKALAWFDRWLTVP